MAKRERFKKGVPVLRITWGGDLYRVELANGDYFFISEVEKWELDNLRPDQSFQVSDMGRVFILWRERKQLIAYERAPERGLGKEGGIFHAV